MRTVIGILSLSMVVGLASTAMAVPVTFIVPLEGAQEVPGPGDPDGVGTAFLSIDPDTLTIDWDITVSDIDLPLTGVHIHAAPAGVEGPIVVDFDNHLGGTGLQDPVLHAVVGSPSSFYVNVHNEAFPAGAIRGQVPEPATISLLGLGLAGLLARRRSAQRRGSASR